MQQFLTSLFTSRNFWKAFYLLGAIILICVIATSLFQTIIFAPWICKIILIGSYLYWLGICLSNFGALMDKNNE